MLSWYNACRQPYIHLPNSEQMLPPSDLTMKLLTNAHQHRLMASSIQSAFSFVSSYRHRQQIKLQEGRHFKI